MDEPLAAPAPLAGAPHPTPTQAEERIAAFTLTELLIALVIVGILVYLALPDYSQVVAQAKATEAKLQLEHLHSLQTTHYYERSQYAGDLGALGFRQQKLVSDGGTANYRIELVNAGPRTYMARATAVADFDQDGQYNVWEIDHDKALREVIPD
ncbi:MAG TPA: prepilin-type N-terminal cleavage/methylation domain-containing protein [Flavobacteriales bacterium]|nr:prepilin-type N-terminal cleavage/methylation domain-containing protein [Flavobacteriales bacterium]HMR28516.1 prepilin-type N-terminal cleavage/methylation domain-containing protein [Flavobacteriales bacterium]